MLQRENVYVHESSYVRVKFVYLAIGFNTVISQCAISSLALNVWNGQTDRAEASYETTSVIF